MKVKIDIDCTPQEARTFFGLPRLEPMQDAVLGKIQERLTDYLDTRDAEALLKLWFPAASRISGRCRRRSGSSSWAGCAPRDPASARRRAEAHAVGST